MKMKKLFSGVLALALACSTLVSVNAATPEAESVSPVITGKVKEIRSGGRATVEFTINTKGNYGVEYDSDYGEYAGDSASGMSAIQVEMTLSSDASDLFSGITGAAVIGNKPTINGNKVVYAFGVSNPYEYAQNGSILFRLTCTLKDTSMTLDQLKGYNLVESFDKLIVTTRSYAVADYVLGDLVNVTQYRTDGEGDYTDVTGVYEYIPATEPDPEPADPNRTAVTATFTATTTTYVEVELVGKGTNSYALPSGVKGNGLVAGILKYTVGEAGQNGVAPVAGDTFNVNVKNLGSSDFTTILTEKVQ